MPRLGTEPLVEAALKEDSADQGIGKMTTAEFNAAVKIFDKAVSRGQGHVYKGAPEAMKIIDWSRTLDLLLLQADLRDAARMTAAQNMRLTIIVAASCLDFNEPAVAAHWRTVQGTAKTVQALVLSVQARFGHHDPMREIWAKWNKMEQGPRRFDTFYRDLTTVAEQLSGEITPGLLFRKLEAATRADVRLHYHDRALGIEPHDYVALARLYAAADDAIRETALLRRETATAPPPRAVPKGGAAGAAASGSAAAQPASTATAGRPTQSGIPSSFRQKWAVSPEKWAKMPVPDRLEHIRKRNDAYTAARKAAAAARPATTNAVQINRSDAAVPGTADPGIVAIKLGDQKITQSTDVGEIAHAIGRAKLPQSPGQPIAGPSAYQSTVVESSGLRARGPALGVWVVIGGHMARCNLDSGTTNSILNDRFVALHKLPMNRYAVPGRTNMAFRGSKGTVAAWTMLQLAVEQDALGDHHFEIGAVEGWDALIGMDFIHRYCVLIDGGTLTATYQTSGERRPLAMAADEAAVVAICQITVAPAIDVDRAIQISRIFNPASSEFRAIVAELRTLTTAGASRETLIAAVVRHGVARGVFREDKRLPFGIPPLRYMKDDGADLNHYWAEIDPSFRPKSRPTRYPARYESQIAEKAAQYRAEGRWFVMATDDVIPTFCVPKKDPSKARLVFDERPRNANRVKDKTPLPNMQNIVERAHAATHKSQFDLVVAYEQLRLRRDMEPKSGFTTPFGAMGSRVGSMGDCNMPGSFQRNMNYIAAERLGVSIFPYLDNLIVLTNGALHDHLLEIVWLIERCAEGEWYLGEWEIDADQMEVLGFSVGKRGLVPCARVLDPILNAPQPRSIAQVDRMLGAFNFCARHATAESAVAKTYLSDATRFRKPRRGQKASPRAHGFPAFTLNGRFVWTPACAAAWEVLRRDMAQCLRLRAFDSASAALQTYLICDASLVGLAGYVAQGPISGTWEDSWPISCFARAFTATESNYSTTVQEKLAVVQSLIHFEHLLRGMSFVICTDHAALVAQATTGKPATDRKMARWQAYIDTFDMRYQHIPGDGNLLADTLSRLWEGYTVDEVPAIKSVDDEPWRWNMARVQATTTTAVSPQSSPLGLIDDGLVAELAEVSETDRVFVRAATIASVFGEQCLKELVAAQAADPLYRSLYEVPGNYRNFRAARGADQLLRLDGRVAVPLAFQWNARPFTETLTVYVHREKVHVGLRDTPLGLAGYFWVGQRKSVDDVVRRCDECQRAKHRSTKPPGHYQAMPIRTAGFKHVAWDFQGPFTPNADHDGVERTAL